MRRPLRRAAALLPGALLLAALALPGSARADVPAPADSGTVLDNPAAAAATWAVSRLTDGSNASGDVGLTADLAMALAATGTDGAAADRITDWLAANAGGYVNPAGADTVFAGGTAKLALVASIQGRDAGDFGGHDLTGTLLGRLQDNGRFTDTPSDGSNQFTQALAVLALEHIDEAPKSAVDFLVSRQCPDGGFPLALNRTPENCVADPDSTGIAVQAAVAADRTAEVLPSLDWLESTQHTSGGFFDARWPSRPNSNSTALAVQALAAGGRDAAAERGVAWLWTVQVGCDADPTDRGAVGYEEPVANGMALRATAQVIPALAGKALGELDGTTGARDPYVIDCTPDNGSGGTDGGSGSADGATGSTGSVGSTGSTGDSDGSTSGSSGSNDGSSDGSSGGDDGSAGGSDAANGGSGDACSSGDTDAAAPGGSLGDPRGSGSTTNDPTPDGGLAATGSSAMTVFVTALVLLTAGAAAYVLTLRRRRTTA